MTYWVGLVLMAWTSIATARDLRVVNEAWAKTDSSLARAHLTDAECAKRDNRLACAIALNRAASYLPSLEHVEQVDGTWRLVPGLTNHGSTTFETYQTKNDYLAKLASWANSPAPLNFSSLMNEILRRKTSATPTALIWGTALSSYLEAFDAHANLQPSARLDTSGERGERRGLGFNLDSLSNGVFVHEVDERSPALAAGLRADDQLLEIQRDNHAPTSIAGLTPAEVTRLLEGPVGTRFVLHIRRGQVEVSIAIVAAAYDVSFVRAQVLTPGLGILQIDTFRNPAVCEQVGAAIEALKAHGVNRLIVDLRGNPGGDAATTVCTAGYFVGREIIYSDESVPSTLPAWARSFESTQLSLGRHDYISEQERTWNGPIVVLVDGLSASGAEILAQAIRHYRADSWIVGETTYGKGSEQMRTALLAGQALTMTYTVGKLILAGELENQLVGITPDFKIPLRFGASDPDRYYPNEGDMHPDARPAASAQPWTNPRKFETSVVQACVDARGNLAEERARLVDLVGRADNQIAFAGAILRCLD